MKKNKAVYLLTAVNLVNYLDRYLLAAVSPLVQKDLNLSNFEVGLLMSAFMIGYMVASPIFGLLGDTRSRPPLMAFGVILWSIATAVSGATTSFLTFFCARLFVGFGEASYASLSPGYISDQLDNPRLINKALGIFYTAIPVGAAMGYLWGGLIAKQFSWHWVFFTGAIPGFLAALFVYRLKDQRKNVREVDVMKTSIMSGLKEIILNAKYLIGLRDYRLIVFAYTAYTFALGGFAAWAPQFGVKVLGADLTQINLYLGAVTISSGIIGTLMGGKWGNIFIAENTDKASVFGFNRFCFWVSLLAFPFGCLMLATNNHIVFLFAIFCMQTLLFSASAPVNSASLAAAPKHLMASAMALQIFVIHALGDLISPAFVGLLADHMALPLAMSLLLVAMLVSVFIWRQSLKKAQ